MVKSNECHICRESLRRSRRGVRQYCDHPYHTKCLDEWRQKNPQWNGKCFYCFATMDLTNPLRSDLPAEDELVGVDGVRRCPRCRAHYVRDGGSDYITCRCGHEFRTSAPEPIQQLPPIQLPTQPDFRFNSILFCMLFACGTVVFVSIFMYWYIVSQKNPSHLHPVDLQIIQWLNSWTIIEWVNCLMGCFLVALCPLPVYDFVSRLCRQPNTFSMNNVLHL